MNKKDFLSLDGLDWLIVKPILEIARQLPYAGFLPLVSKAACKKALEERPFISRDLQIFSEKLCELARKDKRISKFLLEKPPDSERDYMIFNYPCDFHRYGEHYVSEAIYRKLNALLHSDFNREGIFPWNGHIGYWQIPTAHECLRLHFGVPHLYRKKAVGVLVLGLSRTAETLYEYMTFAHALNDLVRWTGKENIRWTGVRYGEKEGWVNCRTWGQSDNFGVLLNFPFRSQLFEELYVRVAGMDIRKALDVLKGFREERGNDVVALVREELAKNGLGVLFNAEGLDVR